MSYNFFIVGGDQRMYYLAEKLINDGHNVKMMGFEKIDKQKLLNNNIKLAHSIKEIEKTDVVIGAIPLSMDGKYVYMPYSETKLTIEEIDGKNIIAGNIPEKIKGIDILKDESITILNAIPTVEGAIAKAIMESNITLNKNNVLVLGFGRIGKILCDRLKGFGANVYCEARNEKDLTWIKVMGCEPIDLSNLNENLCKMKIIFNTIPHIILDKSRLILLKPNTLLIDLASAPGGIDYSTANKLGIKNISYRGIPGKIAPNTIADYIKNYIYKIV